MDFKGIKQVLAGLNIGDRVRIIYEGGFFRKTNTIDGYVHTAGIIYLEIHTQPPSEHGDPMPFRMFSPDNKYYWEQIKDCKILQKASDSRQLCD